jgi:glycerol-3-phosphate dehydrogenase
MIPKTSDGRVLFAIPWYGKVVVGTTDTPIDSIEVEPRAMKKEIDFILETAGRFLSRQPQISDILSVFAGLRPLAANLDNKSTTKEISRNYKIAVSSSGLISILGGKWTIYRRMAEDTLNKTIELAGLEPKPCKTKNLKLSQTPENITMKRLKIYGEHASEIEQLMKDQPSWAKRLHASFEYTKAEIVWICRNEMPVMLEDMLARRLRALLLDAGASAEIAPAIVKIMAKELDHDKNWEHEQLLAYKHLLRYYLSIEKALS